MVSALVMITFRPKHEIFGICVGMSENGNNGAWVNLAVGSKVVVEDNLSHSCLFS